MSAEEGTCKTCRHADVKEEGGDFILCRKRSPVRCKDGIGRFPITHLDGWCGDWLWLPAKASERGWRNTRTGEMLDKRVLPGTSDIHEPVKGVK
jgi:hypothetical protein